MIRSSLARRCWAALLVAVSTLSLVGCGSGGDKDSDNASMRVLNATTDLSSIDVYLDDTKNFGAVTQDGVTAFVTVDAKAYTVRVRSAGEAATLFSTSQSLSGDKTYTGIVSGRNGSLRFTALPEDDDVNDIAAGNGRIRVFNATADSGTLDVFLTEGVDDLSNASPNFAAAAPGTFGAYRELSAGTYRLRVTTAGRPGEVRLDVPVTLTAKQYATLVVTAGSGGVLVNGALLVQQGALTTLSNPQARIRVVAGAENQGAVTATVAGTTVAQLSSPLIGTYTSVNAGDRNVTVTIDGVAVSNTTRTLTAGADYTLIVAGTPGAPIVSLITDDNRLPTTGNYRLRLVNASATAGPVTLAVDFQALISGVAPGAASSYVTAAATTDSRIDVKTVSGTTLQTITDVRLQSLGVYTAFVLGGAAQPTVTLTR